MRLDEHYPERGREPFSLRHRVYGHTVRKVWMSITPRGDENYAQQATPQPNTQPVWMSITPRGDENRTILLVRSTAKFG